MNHYPMVAPLLYLTILYHNGLTTTGSQWKWLSVICPFVQDVEPWIAQTQACQLCCLCMACMNRSSYLQNADDKNTWHFLLANACKPRRRTDSKRLELSQREALTVWLFAGFQYSRRSPISSPAVLTASRPKILADET